MESTTDPEERRQLVGGEERQVQVQVEVQVAKEPKQVTAYLGFS